MKGFKEFINLTAQKKCPEGYRFDKKLGVCVPIGHKGYYPYYGYRNGGNGNDTLFGGTDAEILTGGTGSDSFWFSKNSGNDIIKDYSKAEGDKIVFFRESGDTENFSISDSNKIKWGSLSIELEGVSLSSENDVFVEFIEIA